MPHTTAGLATTGKPFFHIGLTGASHNSTAILGVSLGVLPAPFYPARKIVF